MVLPDDGVELPPLSQVEAMVTEHSLLGVFTGAHPLTLYRPWLAQQSILSGQELAANNRQRVRIPGFIVVHQAPPSAKGNHFITLEDEDGLIDVIVRPQVCSHCKPGSAIAPFVEKTIRNFQLAQTVYRPLLLSTLCVEVYPLHSGEARGSFDSESKHFPKEFLTTS